MYLKVRAGTRERETPAFAVTCVEAPIARLYKNPTRLVFRAQQKSDEAAQAGDGAGEFKSSYTAVGRRDEAPNAAPKNRLLVRATLQGVTVDVTCDGRFYYQFILQEGVWRIRNRGGIYEKDRVECVDPSASVALDPAELMRYPAGYQHLAYLQASGGATITPDLPTPGSASLATLYAEGAAWLAVA